MAVTKDLRPGGTARGSLTLTETRGEKLDKNVWWIIIIEAIYQE
jgi:hypothetical protein